MNSRYANIKTKKNNTNKIVGKSVLYPPIPRKAQDIYIITAVGDRLDVLAKKYYDHVNLYWIIAEANSIGKGTLEIMVGTQLRIPTDLYSIQQDFEKLNP